MVWYMGKRTSVYLTADDLARIEAAGSPSLQVLIREGLASREQAEVTVAHAPPAGEVVWEGTGAGGGRVRVIDTGEGPPECPPHPSGRVIKGFCGACGRPVGDERVA
jgi:hypothetical protein